MDAANGVSNSAAGENEEACSMVIAKYAFEGRNNDELSFSKNDIILVTQRLEGGWWEGSLNGRVGWFPADFVGIVKSGEGDGEGKRRTGRGVAEDGVDSGGQTDAEMEQSRLAYRNEVLAAYVKREQDYVTSLERLHHTLLNDYVASSGALSETERASLTSNLAAIIDFSRHLLLVVEHQLQQRSPEEQWIGKAFLDGAQELYPLMEQYCERHCLGVQLVQRRRTELEKALAEHNVELNELLAAMSQVFRHVKQYAGFLQEVERNTNETHADRGNLQRACVVYRELYEHCEFVRKQKEVQMEFINRGVLQGEFGPEWREVLGSPVHIGNISVPISPTTNAPGTDAWTDRCISVFSKAIVLWETVSTGGGYLLRQRIALDEVKAKKDDTQLELRLKINGPPSKAVRLRALAREDYHRLVGALGTCGVTVLPTETVVHNTSHSADVQPRRAPAEHSQDSTANTLLRLNHELEMILPEGSPRSSVCNATLPPVASSSGEPPPVPPSRHDAGRTRLYSGWALRPVPAMRRELPGRMANGGQAVGIKLRKGLTQEEQEDAQLLKLVDGYFAAGAARNRHSGNQPCHRSAQQHHHQGSPQHHTGVRRASSYPEEVRLDAGRPQLIVADDEKLFVEERGEGGEVVVKEKSLVDTVYSLKDRLESLQQEFTHLSKELEREQRARRRLEDVLIRRGRDGGDSGDVMASSPTVDGLATSVTKKRETDNEA